MLGELDFTLDNLFVNVERVVVEERRVARQHFENEDAKSPPVDSLAVTLTIDAEGKEREEDTHRRDVCES